jgi:hypothetical protein
LQRKRAFLSLAICEQEANPCLYRLVRILMLVSRTRGVAGCSTKARIDAKPTC